MYEINGFETTTSLSQDHFCNGRLPVGGSSGTDIGRRSHGHHIRHAVDVVDGCAAVVTRSLRVGESTQVVGVGIESGAESSACESELSVHGSDSIAGCCGR